MLIGTDLKVRKHFDLWLNACEEYGTKVFCLEKHGETAMYKTWNEYMPKYYSSYRTQAVFHVWHNGERIYCGTDYQEAERTYERCAK